MKTSKIKSVDNVSEWGQGTDRHVFYHNLTMENGDKINIGFKSQQQTGIELNYEVTGQGQEWNKAKRVNPEFKKGGGFKKGSNGSFALSYAKDVVCAFGVPSDQDGDHVADYTTAIADKFKKWLDENE